MDIIMGLFAVVFIVGAILFSGGSDDMNDGHGDW